ncbi:MAG: DUF5666 domain-containing protein [Candidatus Daviesbacteria bacterium]|nr:DUF5666 domain-containing protein [Candidatus Daviesbacteria bacterium]
MRIKKLESRIKVIFYIYSIVFFFILYSLFSSFAFAVDSTQSASPSSSLQTKLKELRDDIASKAAEFKAEVSGKLQNKAYFGAIKTKAEESLILVIQDNNKTVKINEFTEFGGSSKIKPTFKNLEVGNFVVALGDVDETDILTAKKIIKTTPPAEIKQIYFGEVLAVNENMITLKTDKNLAVSTNNQTIFKTSKGDGTLKNIKIGKKIVVSGVNKNNIIKSSLIYSFN